jgi:hypothetical protein
VSKPKNCGSCSKQWEKSCRANPPTAHVLVSPVGGTPIVLGVYPKVTPEQPGCFAHEEEAKS